MRGRAFRVALAAVAVTALAACGEEGSSDEGAAPASSAAGSAAAGAGSCEPVSGDELVVLEDDKKLQTVDNIIPAVTAKSSSQPLIAALDKVSAALTTDDLVALNKRVVVDRETSPNVAKDYVAEKGLAQGLSGGSGKIVVGAANFAENQTLAEIYALALDAAGFDASTRTIGNREVYLPALTKGQIQVVPEYAGTLAEFLNKQENGADAEAKASSDLDATVSALTTLGESAGLAFGAPSQAADQNAFAVTKAFADEHSVSTLSDLASACGSGLVLAGPPECPERPFCRPGLESTYGLSFESFTPLDAGGPLTQAALKQGRATLGLVFSSDGALSAG
ncbi:glycine betaine ABC transporter substrate-binding protein [Motilibacter deserti]|uniref:Glycine/betaine ABC transporter substrate-binding protein n=1 Tax=Motilibacter deserti TaxID=2714956 RepID=A0ABX0H346_9ACTN|nr:glycine/betaine ABC transporter substrate-binding protein [Motilibacter deserti]